MSADLQNFRQAVERFDELVVELERIDDKLSSNFSSYQSLNDDLQRINDIIHSITNAQGKSVEITDKIYALGKNINSMYDNKHIIIKKDLNDFKEQIEEIVSDINYNIKQSVNNVDLTQFEREVKNLFDGKRKELELQTAKLDTSSAKLKSISNDIDKTITNANDNIDSAIAKYNSMAKLVSYSGLAFTFGAGLLIGAVAFSFFGFGFLKDKIFKDEQMAISLFKKKTGEMEAKYIAASELEKVAREYEIKFFQDKEGKYILIPAKKVKDDYKTPKNYQVWELY